MTSGLSTSTSGMTKDHTRSGRRSAATTSKTSVYVGRRKLISRRAIAGIARLARGSARKRGK